MRTEQCDPCGISISVRCPICSGLMLCRNPSRQLSGHFFSIRSHKCCTFLAILICTLRQSHPSFQCETIAQLPSILMWKSREFHHRGIVPWGTGNVIMTWYFGAWFLLLDVTGVRTTCLSELMSTEEKRQHIEFCEKTASLLILSELIIKHAFQSELNLEFATK